MKNKNFRPVEFWKSAIMTMPDNSFFELMRSVFGKIKTPFKKQQLINDLETFLLREDIQKTIAAYIDQNDAKVIAAAALFGEPAPGELESFFSGELSYAQLQDIIVNLEERFILYRFTEEKLARLALNPVLEQTIAPFTTNVSLLFPAVCAPEDTASGDAASMDAASEKFTVAPKAILDDRILAGLLSFVSREELFFRAEGVIRKRVLEAGKACFNRLDLPLVLGSLQILGLFYADADKLVPDKKRFDDFGSLSARERREYCAAALITREEMRSLMPILPPLFRNRIREVTNFIHGFLDSLDAGQKYHEKTLMRFAGILKAKAGIFIGGALLDALEKTGLLTSPSPGIKQRCVIVQDNPAELNEQVIKEQVLKEPVIAVDSGFSVIVYPEINYADAIMLASFMNVMEAGAVVRFELNKDTVVRAFNNNIRADEIIDLLGRLSGGRLDDNLIWNLKDWEKRYGEVSLKSGVILTLSEDRRYLTETMPLSGLISETLAPGTYLLPSNAMDKAAAALSAAGIDIISRRKEKSAVSAPITDASLIAAQANKYFPPPVSDFQKEITEKTGVSAADSNSAPSMIESSKRSALTENFHAILKEMPLGEVERAELSARIDRRLVLCETQLKEASIRYEKLEARNMDYAGKQNVAKQAIAQRSPVEIIWPGGGRERIFGIPKALEKEGEDIVLVIVPAGGQDEMLIPLGKISLLRRIKKSIFEI